MCMRILIIELIGRVFSELINSSLDLGKLTMEFLGIMRLKVNI